MRRIDRDSVTLSLVVVRSTVVSLSVRLSVCLFVCLFVCFSVRSRISETTRPNLTSFYIRVSRGCDLVLM